MDLFANLEIRGGFLKLPCYYFSRCSGSIGCFMPRGSITMHKGVHLKWLFLLNVRVPSERGDFNVHVQ